MQERRKTNGKEFDKYLNERMKFLLSLHKKKSEEYAESDDRLANFREGAALERESPEKYLLGLAAKQEVSLRDFVKRMDEGRFTSLSQWQEKTGDIIVYMLLMEGLAMEHLPEEFLS